MLSREQKIKTKTFLDWLIEFTDRTKNKTWDDETAEFSVGHFSERDMKNVSLLGCFAIHIQDLAHSQNILSLPCNRTEEFKYHIKINDNFYEIYLLASNGFITVIKKIDEPTDSFVYVNEKINKDVFNKREFVQYILLNNELNLPESVYSVHIAHACTICAMKENKEEKFNLWFNGKQKIIILDAPQKDMEKLEKNFYGIRDVGHNDIPKDSLVALSLGIQQKDKAIKYIKNCKLHRA